MSLSCMDKCKEAVIGKVSVNTRFTELLACDTLCERHPCDSIFNRCRQQQQQQLFPPVMKTTLIEGEFNDDIDDDMCE